MSGRKNGLINSRGIQLYQGLGVRIYILHPKPYTLITQAKLAYQFGRAVKGNHLLILSARHQLTTEN